VTTTWSSPSAPESFRRTQAEPKAETIAKGKAAFRVDKQKYAVTYFGEPLDLSRYEFRILEALLERPGWVFSRDQIMNRVWEEPESSLDRTVDTHIKTLRSKLHKIKPKLAPIQTHCGLGYSLRESL
jgi:two-component system catabolic regulation response regulator CreB